MTHVITVAVIAAMCLLALLGYLFHVLAVAMLYIFVYYLVSLITDCED